MAGGFLERENAAGVGPAAPACFQATDSLVYTIGDIARGTQDAEQSSRGAGQLFTLDRERFTEQERCRIRDFFGRNVFDRSGSTPIVGQAVAKVAVQRKGGRPQEGTSS